MAELERSLGLATTTLLGVGVILGAGIYALVGQAAGMAGNAVWISFLVAAVVAAFTGLSYAELASFIPRAGGEYHYAQRAFGDTVAFLVTWLLLGGLAIASAAVALGFGGYAAPLLGLESGAGPALGLIAMCVGLLCWGINQSAMVAVACTLLEILGLIVVLAVGLPDLGEVDLLAMPNGTVGLAQAAALIFFAYIGFEEIVQLAEETRNPTHTLPRALLGAIALTTVLYVLVALAAVSVVGAEALGESSSPLADVVEVKLGAEAAAAMSVIALFSTGNTVLILLMSAARILYGMAEDGALPGFLARLDGAKPEPRLATLAVGLGAAVIVSTVTDIGQAANLTNFSLFLTFVIINLAVVALRLKEPDVERPFRVPGAIGRVPLLPIAGAASAFLMVGGVGLGVVVAGGAYMAVGFGVRAMTGSSPQTG